MIPGNILNRHVVEAMGIIDRMGVPNNRISNKFDLLYNNNKYPPKYIISVANKIVNNTDLDTESYSGGDESNNFLIRLGFTIIDKKGDTVNSKRNVNNKYLFINRQNKHIPNSHCSECKNIIYEMLRTLYGIIKVEHKFPISTKLEDYNNLYVYPYLEKIYLNLIKYRGYNNFIRKPSLHNCDVYVVENDFVIEIDEVQHFSEARHISLMNYPSNLKLKYDIGYWIDLCGKYNACDNHPIYRDEQRAWYDTLRDFLPLIDKSFQSTLRICVGGYEWCALNPNNTNDVKIFSKRIGI